MNKLCVCKGIRKCALCTNNDENEVKTCEIIPKYLYCVNCKNCRQVDKTQNSKDLFLIECNNDCKLNLINGVTLIENILNENEETYLINNINKSKWIDSQSGRLKQDYGPKVNFKKKKLKYNLFTGLPIYSRILIEKLRNLNELRDFIPIELCNLKYLEKLGASIDSHFDDFWVWGDRLITFNLLSNTYLTMTPSVELLESKFIDNCEILIPLKRFSMVCLNSDARHKWLHSIKRGDISNIRLAITLRELSKRFKDNGSDAIIGSTIEYIASSYNGLSVGEIEQYFKDIKMRKKRDDNEIDEIDLVISINLNYNIDSTTLKLNKWHYLIVDKSNHKKYFAKIFHETNNRLASEYVKYQTNLTTCIPGTPKILQSNKNCYLTPLEKNNTIYLLQENKERSEKFEMSLVDLGKYVSQLHSLSSKYIQSIESLNVLPDECLIENANENLSLIVMDDHKKSKLLAVIRNHRNHNQYRTRLKGFIDFNLSSTEDANRVNIEYSYYVYELAICVWKYIIYKHETVITFHTVKNISDSILNSYNNFSDFKIDTYDLYWSILFTLSLAIIHDCNIISEKHWILFDILFFYDMSELL